MGWALDAIGGACATGGIDVCPHPATSSVAGKKRSANLVLIFIDRFSLSKGGP
jgi:hypothetical protein